MILDIFQFRCVAKYALRELNSHWQSVEMQYIRSAQNYFGSSYLNIN